MSALRQRWHREQFEPTWLGWLVNPFCFARRGLWQEMAALLPAIRGAVLDVGCGRKPYRRLTPAESYTGLDLDTPTNRALATADVYYAGGTLPFADASFDAVICSQVLEHVFEPEVFLREIGRVLRPGGRLVLTVPFVWDEHEQPRDYARYSSFGLRALLERTGYSVEVQRKSTVGVRALAQLASGWVFKATLTGNNRLNLVAQLGLIAPVNLAGLLVAAILPANADFYLDNVVLARKAAPGAA